MNRRCVARASRSPRDGVSTSTIESVARGSSWSARPAAWQGVTRRAENRRPLDDGSGVSCRSQLVRLVTSPCPASRFPSSGSANGPSSRVDRGAHALREESRRLRRADDAGARGTEPIAASNATNEIAHALSVTPEAVSKQLGASTVSSVTPATRWPWPRCRTRHYIPRISSSRSARSAATCATSASDGLPSVR